MSNALKALSILAVLAVGSALVFVFRSSSGTPSSELEIAQHSGVLDERRLLQDLPVSTPTPENTSLIDKSSQYLCDHLQELQQMPWDRTEYSGDAVYDALKRKGREAVPCLIDKVTDTRPAQNPTGAPFWAGLTYRVGDTAVNVLMDINDMYWPKGMLSKKYEDMFKEEGMFSYYFYVDEVPGARRKIQKWWENWQSTCKPTCAVVPSIEK
jgi:hypothetical protein